VWTLNGLLNRLHRKVSGSTPVLSAKDFHGGPQNQEIPVRRLATNPRYVGTLVARTHQTVRYRPLSW
jgi:hypothetical protein